MLIERSRDVCGLDEAWQRKVSQNSSACVQYTEDYALQSRVRVRQAKSGEQPLVEQAEDDLVDRATQWFWDDTEHEIEGGESGFMIGFGVDHVLFLVRTRPSLESRVRVGNACDAHSNTDFAPIA